MGSAPEAFGVTTPKVKGGLKASPTESLCSAAQRVITETSQIYSRETLGNVVCLRLKKRRWSTVALACLFNSLFPAKGDSAPLSFNRRLV